MVRPLPSSRGSGPCYLYDLQSSKKGKGKIVHLNALKEYRDRPLQVCHQTVVVDDEEDNLEGT